jgi:transcriptional regulator with XRE-family HTH domain
MNYNKLEEEIKLNKISITKLAEKLNITYRALRRKLNLKILSVAELEIISKELNKPITYWFDDVGYISLGSHNHINGNNNKVEIQLKSDVEKLQNEIDNLKIQIKLKDELIELLREQVKMLKKLEKS